MASGKQGEQQAAEVLPPEFYQTSVGQQEGWLKIGQYKVFAWSVSGLESCVVIKSEDMTLVFDMGVAVAESVRVPNVFITPNLASSDFHLSGPLASFRRHGFWKEGDLVDELKNRFAHLDLDFFRLNTRYFVKAFPTIHRVPSQGYIVYKEEKKLKKEFQGMAGFDIAALHRQGTDIHDLIVTPEIAYTGDTVFDVFTNPHNPDVLRVKLLITEATFLDDDLGKNMLKKAHEFGHIHLSEIADNADVFQNVGHIVLVHFSNKYSPKYISDCIRDKLPLQLKGKVTPATVAKATTMSSS
ncbi:ribonuclease Z [Elysia marginata]|uniref:Ribonuclease Z n=1 Tax=Elysia marginata TaxID=1093978 RepID=A0AAV4GXN3_9GAST|nr:ribonuclease Z [Elysia marginata]